VVFGVDLDVFIGQIAGPDLGLTAAQAQVGGETDLGRIQGGLGRRRVEA